MYILFKYENWDNKHPIGIITNNLGPVDELSNFYEYILFCKSLQISISNFTKETVKKLKTNTGDDYKEQICKNIILKIGHRVKIFIIYLQLMVKQHKILMTRLVLKTIQLVYIFLMSLYGLKL